MGFELEYMELEHLDHILNEISKGNTRDMSTFRDLMKEWYGGIDIRQYQKLENFIRDELGIYSDAELSDTDANQRQRIIDFLH